MSRLSRSALSTLTATLICVATLTLGHTASAQPAPAQPAPAQPAPAPSGATGPSVGDAYATRGDNACSWSLGTAAIEKTFTFAAPPGAAAGTYTLTSFQNKLANPAAQYVPAGSASPEFRFHWDGVALTGATPGWSCRSGNARQVTVGGHPALQLDVAVERPDVSVTKHYIVYPHESLIREWTDYRNTGHSPHTLANPSFMEQHLMGSEIAAGHVQLNYMTGARAVAGSWNLQTTPLASTYARMFDSYDQFGCAANVTTCPTAGWAETSSAYIPWFSLWNTAQDNGAYMGFDYYGRWAAPIGEQGGEPGGLSLVIPNYNKALAPGEFAHSPKAFVGVYKTDLDDMTNRLLDWQYRYMWDYTRPAYFAKIRMLGYWYNGAACFTAGKPDYSGTLQKVFGLVDHMSYIGAGTYHRDCGWWNAAGDWQGPDWKISKNYLAKHGMQQLIYYWAYDANTDSQVYQDHPDWFQTASPCGYAQRLIDLTNPAAERWVGDLLISKAKQWGDYQWRNDSCQVGPWGGAQQLGQDQAFRRVQQRFLDAQPGSTLDGVDSGGNEVNYEFMRMASGFSITDRDGLAEQYDASRIFPVDKMSGIPDAWNPAACDASYNVLLQFNPDFTGDTNDPERLECMRKLVDTYHYLLREGVAGRWVHQYHPRATDNDRNWFERLSRDGNRGLVIYKGPAASKPVTVYPKGLNPEATYDVRHQFATGHYAASGAQLMNDGIQLPSPAVGELVYLNLPNHPGSGTDHTAPRPPTHVSAALNTNMSYRGVEVTWAPGSDNDWLSYYEVLRNGKVIAKVAQGTYYFDHTPGGSTSANYAVRAVDGDGNISRPAQVHTAKGLDATAVDDAPGGGVVYSGNWQHQSGLTELYRGTLSISASGCHTACQGFSDVQGANNWRYQDQINGVWQDMHTYTASGYLGMPQWHDDTPVTGGFVWPSAEHPGPTNDAARVWTAPKDGSVYLKSHPKKLVQGGNGVVVRITKNGQTIWGPATIGGTDTTGVDADVSGLPVAKGDVIRFEINNNGDWPYDATAWDPDISYQPIGPTPATSATYTFTGSQVTWYAKFTPNEGKALVSIDGKPDATIDLYAPDDNNASVPAYTKSFDLPGRHTIRVEETGTSIPLSSGTAISLDGFQAVTAGATIVQENNPRIRYTGSGWSRRGAALASGGSLNATARAGDSASYTFIGRQVALVGRQCSACGEADVYIDGRYATRIDTYGYRGAEVWQTPVFERSWTVPGRHTVRIVATGTKNIESTGTEVDLDSFQVARRPW
jgi:hypothetical protein